MADPRDGFRQLPLALRLAPAATFDTYVDGDPAALAHIRAVAEGRRSDTIWLAADRGGGKSHLLQAACAAAGASGRRAMYVPLARQRELTPGMLEDLDTLELVALDDVETVAGNAAWERALFGVLTPMTARHPGVLLASARTPSQIAFELRDLASRAGGAIVYRLAPLSDEGRIEALRRHASNRGLRLEHAAAQFLLNRIARDMGTVSAWLDRIDAAALAAKRQITIPLIRSLLESDGGLDRNPGRSAEREP
jgi:DnaA-homolog protein